MIKCDNLNIIWKSKTLYIYTIFFLIMIFMFFNKKNLGVDEWLSYTLSNGVEGINVNFNDGYTYTSTEQLWLENIVVDISRGGAKV